MNRKGFTLIELLVVVLIMAIIITVAVLALGDMGKSRRAKYFAQQLKATVHYAESYAVIQPSKLILQLSGNQLTLKALRMRAHNDGSVDYYWETPSALNNINNSTPSYVQLTFTQKGQNSILINSNGSITPFTLRIAVNNESTYYLLTGNAGGALSISQHTGDNT